MTINLTIHGRLYFEKSERSTRNRLLVQGKRPASVGAVLLTLSKKSQIFKMALIQQTTHLIVSPYRF